MIPNMWTPPTLAERLRGHHADPHMDGSSTVHFSRYPDKPGNFPHKISGEFGLFLKELAEEAEQLQAQVNEYEHALREVTNCNSCTACADVANGALKGVNREDFR